MTRIVDWEDFQKENSLYLENQGIKEPSTAEAFRLGQLAFIAQIAETLGCSLTYNSLDWIDEIGKKLKDEREMEHFDSNSLLYNKKWQLDKPYITEDGIAL
jgi:hypothetical protein